MDAGTAKDKEDAVAAEKKKSPARTISKAEDEGYELVFDILFGIRNTVSARFVLWEAGFVVDASAVRCPWPSRGSCPPRKGRASLMR